MRRGIAIAFALVAAVPTAHAEPVAATPREITVTVGERDGIRLLSNDRRRWHWYWLRKPDARIAKADPPQMLPENDEAVNGLSGRTSVTVLGVRPGVTSGTVGYWNANRTRLFKTVRIRIVVQ
jgi:hypothetical protein